MTDKIALCAIGRMENRYAKEWVNHYKMLGFDKIFIYDNNFGSEEHFEEVLGDEVREGFVKVIDVRDRVNMQKEAYEHCYRQYGWQYKWIAFFDFDEFLTIEGNADIQAFMENYKYAECLFVNYMIYTDSGLLYYDPRPVVERFTTPMPVDRCVTYDFPENNHVKSIVRGGIDGLTFKNPHVPSSPVLICTNVIHCPCPQEPFQPFVHRVAYIRHYTTKTIDEWLTCKVRRGFPSSPKLVNKWRANHLRQFFAINERTEEKERIIKAFEL